MCILFLILFPALLTSANAQPIPIPPPSGPVGVCGVQTPPAATSYKLVWDGGTPEDLTVVTPSSTGATNLVSFCNAQQPGWTHAFTIPAAKFTIGMHTSVVIAINEFGETSGPPKQFNVGLAPGVLTQGAAGVLPQ